MLRQGRTTKVPGSMIPERLTFASDGIVMPYVVSPPVAGAPGDRSSHVICIPVLRREGGLILALPADTVPPVLRDAGQLPDASGLLGPSAVLDVEAVEENEDGAEVLLGFQLPVLVADFQDEAVRYMAPFDPSAHQDATPFSLDHPQAFPECSALVALTLSWVRTQIGERTAFYSAAEGEEEAAAADAELLPALAKASPSPKNPAAKPKRITTAQLAEKVGSLPALTAQLQSVADRQLSLEEKVASGAQAAASAPPPPAHRLPSRFPYRSQVPCQDHQPDPTAPLNSRDCDGPSFAANDTVPTHGRLPGHPRPGRNTVCFNSWGLSLAFRVLRTGSPFAVSLAPLLHLLPASRVSPPKALFPLPLPYFGLFRQPGPHLGSRARHRLAVRRATFVLVAALNHLHSSGAPVPKDAVRRLPNVNQAKALVYLEKLVKAFGATEDVHLPSASRRSSELLARLGELSERLTTLGFSVDRYGAAFPGLNDPADVRGALSPYRGLDSSRLVLSGTANWDPSPHLDSSLYLAFREPQSLLLPSIPPVAGEVPKLHLENPSEVLSVARLWDVNNLLVLSPQGPPPERPFEGVRIFNSLKSASTDRQIGDRRGRNMCEGTIPGPSRFLPSGVMFSCLHIDPFKERLSLNAADRKDFYHQLRVPLRRALTNVLVPPLEASLLKDTKAFHDLTVRSQGKKLWPNGVFACFGAVLQGDALGVEYATSSHQNLLAAHGLLSEDSQICNGVPFPVGGPQSLVEGLVIDDYFAISKVAVPEDGSPPAAVRAFELAKAIYQKEGLLGSDPKDIRDASQAVLVGAELDASKATRALGLALSGAPKSKRLAMSCVTLELARLPATADHLHMCVLGGWVSILLYRRPLMSLLSRSFQLVDSSSVVPGHSRVIPQPRAIASELAMLSVLAPLAVADLSAPWSEALFATDSSDLKGAIVSAQVPATLTQRLWTSALKVSENARLLSRERAALMRFDPEFEILPDPQRPSAARVRRPLALRFHFIEVGVGSGKVTARLRDRGWATGPVLNISESPEYDWSSAQVFLWVVHLVSSGLVDAVLLTPPSATFSAAKNPPLRTYRQPLGIHPTESRTHLCTVLALRSLCLLRVCHRHGVPAALEQPRNSKISRLKTWTDIAALPQASEVFTVGCAFGSPCLKPWRFLAVAFSLQSLARRCSRDHTHAATKASDVYPDSLAVALADAFEKAIRQRHVALEDCALDTEGLESPLVNDLAISLTWCPVKVWKWKRATHINLLEGSCIYRLLLLLARSGGPLRFATLCDSNVARCAVQKGRSPSSGLSKTLRRIAAAALAFGLYPQVPFCPTRLMPADHPTRDTPIPRPGLSIVTPDWDAAEIRALSSLPKLRRWAANWSRLTLLVGRLRPSFGSGI